MTNWVWASLQLTRAPAGGPGCGPGAPGVQSPGSYPAVPSRRAPADSVWLPSPWPEESTGIEVLVLLPGFGEEQERPFGCDPPALRLSSSCQEKLPAGSFTHCLVLLFPWGLHELDPSNTTDHLLLRVLPWHQRPCTQRRNCHVSAPPQVASPLEMLCLAQKLWLPHQSETLSVCIACAPGPRERLAHVCLSTLVPESSMHLCGCSGQWPK